MESETLRKAAIVVASLERPAADALLESLPAEQAGRIRHIIVTLPDVSISEEMAALQDFLAESFPDAGELGGEPLGAKEPEVDGGAGLSAPHAAATPEQPAWAVLDDETLAGYLQHERETTVAVILNQLPHVRAGHLLNLLSAPKQPRILRAMTQVTPVDSSILDEINRELTSWCKQSPGSPRNEADTIRHVRVVLDGVEGPSRAQILAELASSDTVLAKRLGWQANSTTPEDDGPRASARPAAVDSQDSATLG